MAHIDSLCMGCMKDSGGERTCPLCGYRDGTVQAHPLLAARTVLESRYLIGRVVSINGENATYMGYDLNTNVIVRIREYFPENLAERDAAGGDVIPISGCESVYKEYLEKFKVHAKALARMREVSSVAPLYDIFELNGTCYTVSEHVEGLTLSEHLRSSGGSISWEQARALFMPVLNGLSILHDAGILHLGITPDNLVVTKDGKMKLIGFCITSVRMSRTDLRSELSSGYSAFEQYGYEGSQGTWTDVYGFSATLYTALTGQILPPANARQLHEKLVLPSSSVLPTHVVHTLEKGLEVSSDDRIRSCEQLRAELSAAPTSNALTNTATFVAPPKKDKKPKKKSGFTYMLLSMGLVLLIIVVIIITIVLPLTREDDSVSSLVPSYSTPAPSSTKPVSSVDSTGADIKVPNLIGKDYDAITNDGMYSSYNIVIGGYELDDSIKERCVKAQNPSNDTYMNKGDTITVTLSLGPTKRTLPNVAGKSEFEAKFMIVNAGFEIGEQIPMYDPNVTVGNIIKTEQSPGTKYDFKTKINIYISMFSDEEPTDGGSSANRTNE